MSHLLIPDNCRRVPLAYFITFTCYGTWLHGDALMSVDDRHNKFGAPYAMPSMLREKSAANRLKEYPYSLNTNDREVVLQSIIATCRFKDWKLYAVHVRTNHVHVVIDACDIAEKIITFLKANATQELNKNNDIARNKYWTRHGSSRYLWREQDVMSAIEYVVNKQGKPMAVFEWNN